METREANKIIGALADIRRTLDAMRKDLAAANRGKPVPYSPPPQPTYEMVDWNVPVTLDWEDPAIQGTAKMYKGDDGSTRIEITIMAENTGGIDHLINTGFVDALSLDVTEPKDFVDGDDDE